jgi:hypothetical protein
MDWLITITLAAVVSTIIWYVKGPQNMYKLGLLSLFFWGATIMVFIDHLVGSILEKGNFIEIKMSAEAWSVGIAMVATVLAVWSIILVLSDPKGIWRKR